MIVIVAQLRDYHATVVADHLERRGAPVFIADPSELGMGAEISFCPRSPERTEWCRRDGRRLRLSEARAIWFRPKASPVIPPEVDDARERQFIVHEWVEIIRGTFSAFGVPVLNPFRAAFEANKPRQLVLARRAGLAVPDTLFTSSARRAREFCDGPGQVVHKTMTSPDDRLLATKRWNDGDTACLDELELAPTIFQRRVAGSRELRVTAVGGTMFAAEFTTELTDGRLDHAVAHTPYELPASVTRGLRTLLDRLGLPFATLDMRIDPGGEHVFLELNPAGQFLWIEIATGMPISAAVADLLLAAVCDPHSFLQRWG